MKIPQKMRAQGKFVSIFLTLLLMVGAAPAAAQNSEGAAITMTAVAGFDGIYKSEFGVPVHITVGNSGADVEGQLQVALGSVSRPNRVIYAAPISLPTQSNKRVSLYLYLSTGANRLTVELVNQRGQTIQSVQTSILTQMPADDLLYGVVGAEAGRLTFLANVTGSRSDATVAFLNANDLPEAAAAWNALDVLIFNDVDTGQLTVAQLEALKSWTGAGGQLVVTGGPGWQKTTTGLADLLPVTVTGSQSVADLPALRNHAGVPFRDPGPYLVATGNLRHGDLILHQDGLPLLARQPWGRGAVYFLALDPNLAPLRDWDGSPLLWAVIAAATPRLPFWGMGVQNSYTAGNAVESLPSLALPSTLSLFFFLMVYVTIVGPVNYFVLRRLNRRELAWLTIPAIILFFSATAYLAGFQLKGNDVIINQMSVAYGQVNGDRMRVQTLVGLYSPRRTNYDVVFPGNTLVRPFSRGYGSMSADANGGPILWGNEVIATDVRVDVSGIETFVADSYQPLPALDGRAILHLDGNQVNLDVSVQNNSDVAFEHVNLIFGTTVIAVGDLQPGASQTISQRLTATQTMAAAGVTAGFGPTYITPSASFFGGNYDKLVGTTNYYQDREAFPRFQLLESLSPGYGGSAGWAPNGVITLVAWSTHRHLEVTLANKRHTPLGSTLYFLELPVNQTIASGRNVTVPQPLITWRILDERGIYHATATDLYMPPGWIEFEFEPWPEFQGMSVNNLEIVLQQAAGASGQMPLQIRLWDWQQSEWVTLANASWGNTVVTTPHPFIGPANTIRVRLQNDTNASHEIQTIYPKITGDLD